jgi:hypothetical protein
MLPVKLTYTTCCVTDLENTYLWLSLTTGYIIRVMQYREINGIQYENYVKNTVWVKCTVS